MYEQGELFNYQFDQNNPLLFSENSGEKQAIINQDGEAFLYSHFFSKSESDEFFSKLYTEIQWKQETIKIFGEDKLLPRLTAWYGDEGKSYTYSGIKQNPEPWTDTLKLIKSRVEEMAKVTFNSVLLNLYRDGKDSVSWHSDDEPELGKNPIIASVSLGETRKFSLKHKVLKGCKVNLNLPHGSLLLMKGETQHHWQHQISKTTKEVGRRINLTFRLIQSS